MDEEMKKLCDWYWPLFHPVVKYVDENGKVVAVDITDVELDLETVDP